VLTWLTAWTRLIVDEDAAVGVANQAVARVASRRKRLRGTELKLAARHEAARLLAHGVAAVPSEHTSHTRAPAAIAEPESAEPAIAEVGADVYAPRPAGHINATSPQARDPREQTTIGRLEIALETLAPYERLACVSYFLDGVSTDAIAALLGVPRERAVRILEGAAPSIARAVGEDTIPATDEVDVVTR
jgi:DNA-directed RNA polymerase specialized sigma24 family protein